MTAPLDILLPPGGTGPGVLVVHPWWGLNGTVRDYGAALAAQGFVVGLPDAFEGKVVTGKDEAQKLVETYWPTAQAVLTAAYEQFAANPAIAGGISGVGFSFGAFQLLKLQETLPLHRLVTYYADREVDLKTPVLGLFAETDEFADDQPGMIKALKAAGNDAIVYPGTAHWFAEKDRPEFNAAAATDAFDRTVAFLKG
ncbi:MAG: dienelactone hydrolase family protein [Devosia sp.]